MGARDYLVGVRMLVEDFVLAIRAGFQKFYRSADSERCAHVWGPLVTPITNSARELGPCIHCGSAGHVDLKPRLGEADPFHYEDCELYGEGILADGCWCQHRGPRSHYSGTVNPGWHRRLCPEVGKSWEPRRIEDRFPCGCEFQPTWGAFILTMRDGTIHGPAPSPMPGKDS